MYIAGLVIYTVSFGILVADLNIAVFRRKVKHLRFFTLLMFVSCIYALGFLLQQLSLDYSGCLQATRVQYLGAVFVSPMLLFFIMDFCGVKQRPWFILSALIIPVVTVILVFTYPFNGIYFGEASFTTDPAPLLVFSGSTFRIVYFIYSYSTMLASFIICIAYHAKRGALFKKYSIYLIVAVSIPMLGNMLTAFLKLFPIDLTPVFSCIMGTIISYTLLFTGLFDAAPLAREEIVENMQDGFILIDPSGKFLDANRTAKRLFPEIEHATIGLPMANMGMSLWDSEGRLAQEFSVTTDSGEKRYRISSNEVSYRGSVICTCVVIYDNTSVWKLMNEITRMAEYDGLTNLLNRRSFCRDGEKKCAEILRYGGKAFLMMLDIDFFKNVNDSYGHLAGDEALRFIARILSQRFRKTDMVCRYGGEEFCVFLFSVNREQAVEIAEECRRQIDKSLIPFEGKAIHVTMSIGIAEFLPAQDQTLTALISRADEALYEAKAKGRNRVATAH
jgi:diguanylate cyclase (GGDEF)-like protein